MTVNLGLPRHPARWATAAAGELAGTTQRASRGGCRSRRRADGAHDSRRGMALHGSFAADQAVIPAGAHAGSRQTGRHRSLSDRRGGEPARVRRRHPRAGALDRRRRPRSRGREPVHGGDRARDGDRAASRPSRRVRRQRFCRAQHRVSARRGADHRSARSDTRGSGASAVRGYARRCRELSALPAGRRIRQQRDRRRGLSSGCSPRPTSPMP